MVKYWDVNNLDIFTVSRKLHVNGSKWIEHFYEFDDDFMKNENEKSKERHFLEVDIQYWKQIALIW